MNAKLFVSNLSYQCTEDEVIELFSSVGEVVSFRLISDKFSGRSKGFGFMEMGSSEQASKAIEQLNGHMWMERPLVVKEQEERRPARTGGGGGRGGYGGDRGGYGGGGRGRDGGGYGGGYNDGGGNW